MCLGIPAKVVSIEDEWNGIVAVNDVKRSVNLAYIADDVGADLIGKWVLIHVGFAMAVINEEDALRTLALLSELNDDEQVAFIQQG